MLKDNLFPVVLDGCVGCGICVERCPTSPKRAINITPTGMERPDEAGFYFRKAKQSYETSRSSQKVDNSKSLSGEKLLERKFKIEGADKAPDSNSRMRRPGPREIGIEIRAISNCSSNRYLPVDVRYSYPEHL